jgi:hypothetical protein
MHIVMICLGTPPFWQAASGRLMARSLQCYRKLRIIFHMRPAYIPSGIELNYHNLLTHEAQGS